VGEQFLKKQSAVSVSFIYQKAEVQCQFPLYTRKQKCSVSFLYIPESRSVCSLPVNCKLNEGWEREFKLYPTDMATVYVGKGNRIHLQYLWMFLKGYKNCTGNITFCICVKSVSSDGVSPCGGGLEYLHCSPCEP
jgi:hypothetical protein